MKSLGNKTGGKKEDVWATRTHNIDNGHWNADKKGNGTEDKAPEPGTASDSFSDFFANLSTVGLPGNSFKF